MWITLELTEDSIRYLIKTVRLRRAELEQRAVINKGFMPDQDRSEMQTSLHALADLEDQLERYTR